VAVHVDSCLLLSADMLGLRLTAVKPPYLYDHSTTGSVVLQYLSLPTSWDDKQILAKAFEMSVNVPVHNWLAVVSKYCVSFYLGSVGMT